MDKFQLVIDCEVTCYATVVAISIVYVVHHLLILSKKGRHELYIHLTL